MSPKGAVVAWPSSGRVDPDLMQRVLQQGRRAETRYLICEVYASNAAQPMMAAMRLAFRGNFVAEGERVYWEPPAGLGGYTLERIQAFATGWILSAITKAPR